MGGKTELEKIVSEVKEQVTPAEKQLLPWMALLRTGLGEDAIVKEIPDDMKTALSLDKLYALFLEQAGQDPDDRRVMNDIQTLVGGIDKASESPYLRVDGNNVACKLGSAGQVEVPQNVSLAQFGTVVAMNRDPTQKFVLYKIEATKGPKVGYVKIPD